MSPRMLLAAGAGVAVLALVVSLAATAGGESADLELAIGPETTAQSGVIADGPPALAPRANRSTDDEAAQAELRARQTRVDEAERAEMEEAQRQSRRERWQQRMANSPRAQRWQQRMLERFDADGDGVLNEEEEAARRTAMEERRAEQMAQMRGRLEQVWGGEVPLTDQELGQYFRLVGRDIGRQMRDMSQGFDTDGDGRLNEQERQAFQPAQMEMFQQLGRDFIAQNDRDGDGALSDVERLSAAEGIRDQITESGARRAIDTDRDGQFSQTETSGFMAAYQAGNAEADLNGDGAGDMDLFMRLVNER